MNLEQCLTLANTVKINRLGNYTEVLLEGKIKIAFSYECLLGVEAPNRDYWITPAKISNATHQHKILFKDRLSITKLGASL